jgi:hypothetical protein
MSRGRGTDHDHSDECNGLRAVGDHGEDGRQKIAGSDKHRRMQKRKEDQMTRRNKKSRERGRNAGSSGDD